jgi:hypothetical protein
LFTIMLILSILGLLISFFLLSKKKKWILTSLL